jgi:hypothetical protein
MDTDDELRIERIEQQKLAQEHTRDEEHYRENPESYDEWDEEDELVRQSEFERENPDRESYVEWDEADPENYSESYIEWDEADPENYREELEVLDELKGKTANIEPAGTAATCSQSNTGDSTFGSSSKPC